MNWSQFSGYLQARTTDHRFSGVVRVTQGDSECFSLATGYASRDWGIPNNLGMRFDTASITKLLTAVAALQMVDQGAFGLDTCAIPYLGLRDTAISPRATVFHLLTHSSGIGDDADEEAGEVYEDLWRERPCYSVVETADFLPQFAHKPAMFAPGEGCRYNNCAYVLLGLMIEKATGLSYRDYVEQNVMRPAGMHDSGFFRMDRVRQRVAEGADPIRDEGGVVIGWKRNIFSYPPIGSPDSGALVTAADLDRFLRAVRAGRLLSPKLSEAFFEPKVLYRDKGDHTIMYGLGLWFHVRASGEVLFCEKEGVNAGVSGMVRYYPRVDVCAVILSNMEDGAWEPMGRLHDAIMSRYF